MTLGQLPITAAFAAEVLPGFVQKQIKHAIHQKFTSVVGDNGYFMGINNFNKTDSSHLIPFARLVRFIFEML